MAQFNQAGPFTYAILVTVIVLSVFPLYWSGVIASQTADAVARRPPQLIPGGELIDNFARVFQQADFASALLNSLLVSSAITVSVIVFCSLAGFAFAKLRFRGRQGLLLVVVATMVIPMQLGVIPLYIMIGQLGWAGQLPAVIVPGMVTAYGVFWMRQFIIEGVPDELIDAARVDGAHTAGIYWHVIVPAIRPAAAALGLLTFMTAWNDFFWPLVVLTPETQTVQVALAVLSAGRIQDFSLILAATVIATFPIVLVFAVFGKHIIGGIMEGAIK